MTAAVLCDIDGTLVDTTYLHTVCWWRAFTEAGHRIPMIEIHRAVGMGADQLVPHLLGSGPGGSDGSGSDGSEPHGSDGDKAGALSDRHDELFWAYWPTLQPLPGAADLLRAVAGRGVQVVLATSSGGDELDALRRAIDADDAISDVVHADKVPSSKPAPDIVHRALEAAGAAPGEAVFIGDTVWDIRAAHEAGVRCIAVTCGGTAADELRDAGADEIYADPAAVVAAYSASLLARLA